MRASVGQLRLAVLAVFAEGDYTADGVQEKIGGTHQSVSPRVGELAKLGYLMDTGDTKKTRSGRRAVLWTLTSAGSQFLKER